ncbi:hypothetical protein [Halomonas salipaludis]|uniref:Uncharacterized protein n=1 Tax=Halomonas salipaludis TaxID=2032625 RepID=A0A2A2EP60_9GAMM|nr:hypothetical protein [Halomonas salipaludis]PAU74073.1 hypothetical protein CK498_24540 [Halomonas salipaludis]
MLSLSQSPSLQAFFDHCETQRAIRRLTHAMTQRLRLHVEHPALVLAPCLGQPITISNQDALEKWVELALHDLDLPANNEAIEPLCQRLAQVLEEEY